MRILLDESTPRRLAGVVTGHEAMTVRRMGWSGVRNGELLRLAAAEGFDVLLTVDRGIQHQQNIVRSGLAVVILRARSNRFADLLPLVPNLLDVLPTLKAGQVVEIGGVPD